MPATSCPLPAGRRGAPPSKLWPRAGGAAPFVSNVTTSQLCSVLREVIVGSDLNDKPRDGRGLVQHKLVVLGRPAPWQIGISTPTLVISIGISTTRNSPSAPIGLHVPSGWGVGNEEAGSSAEGGATFRHDGIAAVPRHQLCGQMRHGVLDLPHLPRRRRRRRRHPHILYFYSHH